MAVPMQLDALWQQHRALDRRIEEERTRPSADPNQLAVLKREKLKLKDQIERIKVATRH